MRKAFLAVILAIIAANSASALDEDFLKAIRTAQGKDILHRLADEAVRDYPPKDAELYLLFIESRRNAVTAAELTSRVDRLSREMDKGMDELKHLIRDLRDDLISRPAWLDERFDRFRRSLDDYGRRLEDMNRQLGETNRELSRLKK